MCMQIRHPHQAAYACWPLQTGNHLPPDKRHRMIETPLRQTPFVLLLCVALISGCANPSGQRVAKLPTVAATETKAPPAHKPPPAAAAGLWRELSAGFRMPDQNRPEVMAIARYHATHQSATGHTLRRAEPYLWAIAKQIKARKFPNEIALLPAIETRFNPLARSPRGAGGLWQFLPSTAAVYGLKRDDWQDQRLDTVASTRAALDHLGRLHKRFNDWPLALAAYNAGEARVKRAIERNREQGKPVDYWHLDLPKETRNYVPRLLGLATFIAHADQYRFVLPEIHDRDAYRIVKIKRPLDLTLAAHLSGLSLQQLRRYNPSIRHWTTGPDGPKQLVLPSHNGTRLSKALAALPKDQWLNWGSYQIQWGDSLSRIASHHATDMATLRRVNKLKGQYLRAGETLRVPVPRYSRQLAAAGFQLPPALHASAQVQPPPQITKVNARQIRYQIRPGDTLGAIAKAHAVTVEALAGWNNISIDTLLHPGRMLTIWISRRVTQQASDRPL